MAAGLLDVFLQLIVSICDDGAAFGDELVFCVYLLKKMRYLGGEVGDVVDELVEDCCCVFAGHGWFCFPLREGEGGVGVRRHPGVSRELEV